MSSKADVPGAPSNTSGATDSAPAIDPRHALADAAVDAALGPRLLRALRDGRKVVLVIHARDAAWAERCALSISNRFEDTLAEAFTTPKPRAGGVEREDTSLLAGLSRGLSIVAVSQDPAAYVARAVVAAADETISIGDPTVEVMRTVIGRVTGRRTVRGLHLDDYTGLGFEILAAAIRPGDTPAAIIRRLRAIKGRQNAAPAGGTPVPSLHELPLGTSLRTWADQTVADLEAVKAGTMTPGELVFVTLEGPPGTGKTLMARSLAQTAGWNVVSSSVGSWFTVGDGALGGVARNVKAFANAVIDGAPCIGFLDEIDAIPDRRTMDNKGRDWWTPVITLVLTEIDRIRASGRKVLLIGATNYYDRLDDALVRPGRLQQRVSVLPPATESEVVELFRFYGQGELSDSELGKLARIGLGATPAAVEGWLKAGRATARAAGRELQLADILDQAAPKDARSAEDIRVAAIHEAGHAVVAHHLGIAVRRVTIISSGPADGATEWSPPSRVPTLTQLENMATVMLGGRAGDVTLGGGANVGAEADLQQATELLTAARERQGLYGRLAVRRAGDLGLRSDHELEVIDEELDRLLTRAKSIVSANRKRTLALAERLIAERVLSGPEVAALLGKKSPPPDTASTATLSMDPATGDLNLGEAL